jgi:hypothetical protein
MSIDIDAPVEIYKLAHHQGGVTGRANGNMPAYKRG